MNANRRGVAAAVSPEGRPGTAVPRVLQRCGCGAGVGPSGECAECRQKRKPGPHQPRLVVNRPGDRYEREAERLAEQVTGTSVPEGATAAPQRIRRVEGGAGRAEAGTAAGAPKAVHDVLRSPGRPLGRAARRFMEARFGHDFSAVRVHTDRAAAASAGAVAARAYTVGQDVVFGAGEYAPETRRGRRLLAHELAHVLQQSGGSGDVVQRNGGPIMSGMNEPLRTRPAVTPADPPVYICAIDLQTSPVGRHALLRIGSPDPGSETLSLQPFDQGGDCWQGIPLRNDSFDQNARADCEVTSITSECLEREFNAYPVGHYCTWGPNSNTFVGHLAQQCGLANPDPPGWTPGIDESPPPSGTFAPDKWATLTGCETKICIMGRERRPDEPVPVQAPATR